MSGRSKHATIPADFREYALAHTIRETRLHYGVGHPLFYLWCEEIGIADQIRSRPKNPSPQKPMPADFAEHAAKSNAAIRQIYGSTSDGVLARWRKALGVVVRPVKSEEPAPAGFKATVSQMYVSQACRHYDRSDAVVRRWARETGASFKAWNGWNHTRAAPLVDHRPSDVAAKAQSHLQRIGPVYRRGDQFSVFGRLMPAGEMIEFAARKGFDADDWKRL